jgi:hypothetical protein
MPGFDAQRYGKLLIGLRYSRGYRSGQEFANLITGMGVPTNQRALWAIERGEQVASVARHFAFCSVLHPAPGYFEEAFDATADDRQ